MSDRTAIDYAVEPNLPAPEFQQLLHNSGLAPRRPADDLARLDRMLRHSDLIVTARFAGALVGKARSLTDWSYCCYLSDLAVAQHAQRSGIGQRLIERTRAEIGPEVDLILLSAPAAVGFYENIAMPRHPAAFHYRRER